MLAHQGHADKDGVLTWMLAHAALEDHTTWQPPSHRLDGSSRAIFFAFSTAAPPLETVCHSLATLWLQLGDYSIMRYSTVPEGMACQFNSTNMAIDLRLNLVGQS